MLSKSKQAMLRVSHDIFVFKRPAYMNRSGYLHPAQINVCKNKAPVAYNFASIFNGISDVTFSCSREQGHDGMHAAHNGAGAMIAIW